MSERIVLTGTSELESVVLLRGPIIQRERGKSIRCDVAFAHMARPSDGRLARVGRAYGVAGRPTLTGLAGIRTVVPNSHQ